MPKKSYTKAIVISDIHIPFHDPELISAAEKSWKDLAKKHGGLDYIFLNGDIIDCFAVSRFGRTAEMSSASLTDELKETKKFLVRLRKDHPKARIIYVEGNHEFRIRKLIMEPKDSMRWQWIMEFVHIKKTLGLESLNIEYIEHAGTAGPMRVEYGDCLIGHWGVSRSKSGQTATHLLERYPGFKIIQGHTHHAAKVFKEAGRTPVWGVENPCMCPIKDVDYALDPNWQQGFTVLTEVNGIVHSELIVVEQVTRTFMVEGQIYQIAKSKTSGKIDPRVKVK